MSLDQYQPCPCGSGKKIKFCCCKDIVSELEKVTRAMEGEQRVGALEHINRLIEQHGERDALLSYKADVLLSLENFEEARDASLRLLKKVPHNPVALGLSAIIAAIEDEVELAVERLQEALESTEQVMHSAVYSAIHAVAQALLARGDILAARGHWLMQAGLAGDRDRGPVDVLMRIHMAREVPLLMKEDLFYAEAADDAPWKGEFAAAMTSARRGTWMAACESLESLSEKVPGQYPILKNIAILRSWLGQAELATKAWKRVAAVESLPLDERVEAAALAELMDPQSSVDEIDEVTQTYQVPESDALMEVLLSNKLVTPMPVNPAELVGEGEAPPKGAFWLLDRPTLEAKDDLQRDEIPKVLGELFVFGRQTDRDARLEFVVTKSQDFVQKVEALRSVVGQHVAEQPASQDKTGTVPITADTLSWRWRLPDGTSREQQERLVREQQREVLTKKWPDVPTKLLDGKSPREAAQDEKYQVPLLASILVMELSGEVAHRPFAYDELRQLLGLPVSSTLEPGSFDVMRLPLVRMTRLPIEKLTDDQLLASFQRALLKSHSAAIRLLAPELLKRDLSDKIQVEDVYDALIRSCSDTEEALRHLDAARQSSVAKGDSPARWLLSELSIRLPRMEAERCNEIVMTLQSKHINEPGIGEGLYRLLVSYGVITPEGQPTRGAAPPSAVPAGAAAEAGKLWTPGGDSPAPGQAPQKSKLWVPGMD